MHPNRHVNVMRDFNCNLLAGYFYDNTYFINQFRLCDLTILPLIATHHTASSCSTLADRDHIVRHFQYHVPGISRRDLMYCVYKLFTPKAGPNNFEIKLTSTLYDIMYAYHSA